MPVVATDPFANFAHSPDSSASSAVAVTPSDTDDLVNICNAIYVGVSGDVKVDMAGTGTAVVFKACPVGVLRVRARRVYAIGTTATNLLALS